jgi:ABC-type nitrate/sulfonate/bicarbonate transport system permease component
MVKMDSIRSGLAPGRRKRGEGSARMPYASRVRWARFAIVAGLVVALEIYGQLFADPAFLQPPSEVLQAWIVTILPDERIMSALALTMLEIACAYALSVVAGTIIGLAVGATRLAREGFYPLILLLYAVPQVSLIPLFVLTFGLGPVAKVAFGFSHGIFPVIVAVTAGMSDVPALYVRGARSMGASKLDVIRHVVFPHMAPGFFTGLRLAMTMTLLGVILAELYVSTGGIGYFTRVFAENYNPAPLFALIGSLAAIALVFNAGVRVAERRMVGTQRRAHSMDLLE